MEGIESIWLHAPGCWLSAVPECPRDRSIFTIVISTRLCHGGTLVIEDSIPTPGLRLSGLRAVVDCRGALYSRTLSRPIVKLHDDYARKESGFKLCRGMETRQQEFNVTWMGVHVQEATDVGSTGRGGSPLMAQSSPLSLSLKSILWSAYAVCSNPIMSVRLCLLGFLEPLEHCFACASRCVTMCVVVPVALSLSKPVGRAFLVTCYLSVSPAGGRYGN